MFQKAGSSSESVQSFVSSSFLSDESTQSVGSEFAVVVSFSVDVTNVDLNRGVILGGDELVGGGTLRVSDGNERAIVPFGG